MSPWLVSILGLLAGALILLERGGMPVTLQLRLRSDWKREASWFAQYGQMACAGVVAMLLLCIDPDLRSDGHRAPLILAETMAVTGLAALLIKRLLGRVRPGRPQAGRFLGPCFRHASYRESFPSSHSACAIAMTVVLIHLYPAGAPIFWPLAFITAALRYLTEAHWPSDVLAGLALGTAIAELTWHFGRF